MDVDCSLESLPQDLSNNLEKRQWCQLCSNTHLSLSWSFEQTTEQCWAMQVLLWVASRASERTALRCCELWNSGALASKGINGHFAKKIMEQGRLFRCAKFPQFYCWLFLELNCWIPEYLQCKTSTDISHKYYDKPLVIIPLYETSTLTSFYNKQVYHVAVDGGTSEYLQSKAHDNSEHMMVENRLIVPLCEAR